MASEELELVDEATEDGDEAVELDAAQVVTEGAEACESHHDVYVPIPEPV